MDDARNSWVSGLLALGCAIAAVAALLLLTRASEGPTVSQGPGVPLLEVEPSTSPSVGSTRSDLDRRSVAIAPVPSSGDAAPRPSEGPVTGPVPESRSETGVGALCGCPGAMRTEFALFRRLANARGVDLDRSLQMTLDEWSAMQRRVKVLQAELAEIDQERMPVLNRLVDARYADGDYESFRHPDAESDPETRRQLRAAVTDARKARRPGEIVIPGGAGSRLTVIRIQPEDDPALFRIEEIVARLKAEAGDELSAMFHHRLRAQ